jgi:hypothetical protein
MARFALFGVALTVAIFVAGFDPISVLLGFSIVVIGIMGEALYAVVRELASVSATKRLESDGTPLSILYGPVNALAEEASGSTCRITSSWRCSCCFSA